MESDFEVPKKPGLKGAVHTISVSICLATTPAKIDKIFKEHIENKRSVMIADESPVTSAHQHSPVDPQHLKETGLVASTLAAASSFFYLDCSVSILCSHDVYKCFFSSKVSVGWVELKVVKLVDSWKVMNQTNYILFACSNSFLCSFSARLCTGPHCLGAKPP